MKPLILLSHVEMFKRVKLHGRWIPSGRFTSDGKRLWTKQQGQKAIDSFLAKFTEREREMIKLAARVESREQLAQLEGK